MSTRSKMKAVPRITIASRKGRRDPFAVKWDLLNFTYQFGIGRKPFVCPVSSSGGFCPLCVKARLIWGE